MLPELFDDDTLRLPAGVVHLVSRGLRPQDARPAGRQFFPRFDQNFCLAPIVSVIKIVFVVDTQVKQARMLLSPETV